MTVLNDFWPSADNVADCIVDRQEAVKSEAILLAIHQPMILHHVDVENKNREIKKEDDVLAKILAPKPDGGVECVAITGATGAGKTHIIRWLEAQIKRDPRSKDTFKCIRIGKSASLKKVIEQIIEPLKGDKDFNNILAKLENIIPDLDDKAAANDLTAKLRTQLENLEDELNEEIAETGEPTTNDRTKAHHARKLRAYLNSITIEDHIRDKVLMRIVRQAASGNDTSTSSDKSDFEQFEPNDFDIPDTINISEAGADVIRYQGQLDDEETRQFACNVLNSVVGEAVGQVFQIQNLAGGTTWGEVFLEIRKILKRKGQELVFLVEDFFALTGFQRILVSILINEDEARGTEEECCNIRSAIGVTDGYRAENINSYISRAGGVFVVDNEYGTKDEVLNAAVHMVGNYLNAARWGKSQLDRQNDDKQRNEAWPNFYNEGDLSENDNKIIEDFGFSEIGYPLFPLNRKAIVELAKTHLRVGGSISFQPRKFIQKILQEPLKFRQNFETGSFPPSALIATEGFRRKAEIDSYIARLNCGEQDRERLKTFITLWCGNPETVNEINPDEKILKIFKLPKMQTGRGAPTPTPVPVPPDTTGEPTPPTPPPPEPELPLPENRWKFIFENWNTEEIPAADANELRKSIRDFLLKRIRWDVIRVKRPTEEMFKQSLVGIPRSRGGGQGGDKILIADEEEMLDRTGSLREEMTALGNCISMKGWNYEGSQLERAQAYNLIDRLVPKFEEFFIKKAKVELAPLMSVAKSMANLRGTPKEGESDWNNLFCGTDVETLDNYTFENPHYQEIYELRQSALTNAPHLQSLIFNRSACYQGTANTPYTVDIARFMDLPEDTNLRNVQELFPENFAFFNNIQEKRLETKAKKFVEQIGRDIETHLKILNILETGDEDDISNILSNAQGIGILKVLKVSKAEIEGSFNKLGDSKNMQATFTEIEKIISDEQSFSIKMGKILALIDLKDFVTFQANCHTIKEFLESLNQKIEQHPGKVAGSDLIKIQGEINDGLEKIHCEIKALIN